MVRVIWYASTSFALTRAAECLRRLVLTSVLPVVYHDDNHLGLLWSTYILSIIFFVIYLVTKPFVRPRLESSQSTQALDDVDKFACVMQGTLSLILLLTIVLYVEDNLDHDLRARWDREVLSGFLIFLSMALGPALFFFYARLVHGGAPTNASRPLLSSHLFDSFRTSMRGRAAFGGVEQAVQGSRPPESDALEEASPTDDDSPLADDRRLYSLDACKREGPEDVEDTPLNFEMTPVHPSPGDNGEDGKESQDAVPDEAAARSDDHHLVEGSPRQYDDKSTP